MQTNPKMWYWFCYIYIYINISGSGSIAQWNSLWSEWRRSKQQRWNVFEDASVVLVSVILVMGGSRILEKEGVRNPGPALCVTNSPVFVNSSASFLFVSSLNLNPLHLQTCSGSVCLNFDLEECFCEPPQEGDTVDQSCHLCCMDGGELSIYMSDIWKYEHQHLSLSLTRQTR